MKPSKRFGRHMFPKLNLHEREVFRKDRIAHHDSISFYNDHFDRWYGINHSRNEESVFFGVSAWEYMISEKCSMLNEEAEYVGKAT